MTMPYLNFTGRCREAFELYATAFGGEIESLETYGDAPHDPNTTDANRGQVRHAVVRLTEHGRLMGADAAWPVDAGSAVNIMVHLSSSSQAREAFDLLAEGGAVISELGEFEGMQLGALRDRFGFVWQFVVMEANW